MVSIRASTRNPDGDAGHPARRPGILLTVYREFADGPVKCQMDSLAYSRTRIRSPAEGAWPGLIGGRGLLAVCRLELRHDVGRDATALVDILLGANIRPVPVTWDDRRGIAVRHDGQPCPCACST